MGQVVCTTEVTHIMTHSFLLCTYVGIMQPSAPPQGERLCPIFQVSLLLAYEIKTACSRS